MTRHVSSRRRVAPSSAARKHLGLGIFLAGAAFLWTLPAAADAYGVFCAGGRIEVDSRSEEQMRNNRGACQLGRFATRSDAENFARRNFSGVGGSCSCR